MRARTAVVTCAQPRGSCSQTSARTLPTCLGSRLSHPSARATENGQRSRTMTVDRSLGRAEGSTHCPGCGVCAYGTLAGPHHWYHLRQFRANGSAPCGEGLLRHFEEESFFIEGTRGHPYWGRDASTYRGKVAPGLFQVDPPGVGRSHNAWIEALSSIPCIH